MLQFVLFDEVHIEIQRSRRALFSLQATHSRHGGWKRIYLDAGISAPAVHAGG
jgi:hypothetical protein